MDPQNYEVEDFLQDPSFRDYCLGNNEQANNFWEDWIHKNPGRTAVLQEARNLYGMLNGNHNLSHFMEDRQSFIDKMKEHLFLDTVQNDSSQDYTAKPATGGQIHQKRPIFRSMGRIGWVASFMAAASLIVFLLMPFFNEKRSSEISAATYSYAQDSKAGERKSFQLPDGTKVMLNAGSTIQVAKNFNISTREIILSGEAFFDVTHAPQKPFIIHTLSMDVRVLGTVFNIKAYPSDKQTETSLLKGSVEVIVKADPGRSIILHPNEKIVLAGAAEDSPGGTKDSPGQAPPARSVKATVIKEKYKIDKLTYSPMDSSVVEVSWTENRLVFDNTPFDEVATRLERWYNVRIRFENKDAMQYRFTGIFDRKTIDQVLDALQLSRHFDYAENVADGKDQIIIK
ncbi:FecR family protein [Flavitalea flava]